MEVKTASELECFFLELILELLASGRTDGRTDGNNFEKTISQNPLSRMISVKKGVGEYSSKKGQEKRSQFLISRNCKVGSREPTRLFKLVMKALMTTGHLETKKTDYFSKKCKKDCVFSEHALRGDMWGAWPLGFWSSDLGKEGAWPPDF